jgi:hypothetical protein
MVRELLILDTESPSVRAEVVSWGHEDPSLLYWGKSFSYAPNQPVRPPTVLHAMADGWELLAPPTQGNPPASTFTWWLTRPKGE